MRGSLTPFLRVSGLRRPQALAARRAGLSSAQPRQPARPGSVRPGPPLCRAEGSHRLEAWPACKQGRSGVALLGGPQTLEKLEGGGLQRPCKRQRKGTKEDESLLIAIPTWRLGPVQGAQGLVPAPPPPSPEEERPEGGNHCRAGPRLPILGAKSASFLHLPASLRRSRHPAWGMSGVYRDPHSEGLTPQI